jgi:hypothetical protein
MTPATSTKRQGLAKNCDHQRAHQRINQLVAAGLLTMVLSRNVHDRHENPSTS